MKAPTNYRNEIRKRTVRGAPQVGKHHGEGPSDGAQRNARIAAMNADRREQSRTNKETIIAKRTAAAEKRKKETLDMATEDTKLNEVRYPNVDHMGPGRRPHDTKYHTNYKTWKDHADYINSKKHDDNADISSSNKEHVYNVGNAVIAHWDHAKKIGIVKEETGTEARTKIKNVARPDDAEPTSKESTLAKTGEIKTKKIDEGRSMSINRNFGLPESLIAATRALMEKKHDADDMKSIGKNKTEVDTKPTTDDQVNDGDESNVKKKTKKLDPVGKEDDDIDNDGDVDKSDKYLHGRRKAIKKSMKEEAEQIDELKKSGVLSRYINAVKHDVDDDNASPKRKAGYFMALKKKHGDKKYGFDEPRVKGTNEEAEQIDELKKSTLGSYVTKVAKLAPDQVKTSRREGIVKASQKLRKMDREDSSMKEEVESVNEAKHDIAHFVSKVGSNTYHARVSKNGFSLNNQHGIAEHPSAVIDTNFQGYHKADEHARGIVDSFKHGGKEAALKHLNSVTYGHKKFRHADVNEEAEQIDEDRKSVV